MPAKGSHNYGNRISMKAYVSAAKDRPCADCGKKFPRCCMDFDHVRGKKEFALGGNVLFSLSRVIAEIAKCDLVCANCHRIRTSKRAKGKKHKLTHPQAPGTKYGVSFENWNELPDRIN